MTIHDSTASAPDAPPGSAESRHEVCIVGTGRVGLPLGLTFVETGVSAVGLDVDKELADLVNEGVMPFHEPGYDEIIASRRFHVVHDPSVVTRAETIIVTVGTPLHNHIETDLTQVQDVLESIGEHLRPGQLLCLRSTVAPGTTEFVERWIRRNTDLVVGETFFLAFCPERIAEGKAYEEIRTLPQIVGTQDAASEARAVALFRRITREVLTTDYVTAELVKLFNNILRYVHFALANQFAMIADNFGANIHETRELANHGYPRSFLAAPGLTAGTCLRKDFGMLNEWSPYPDMLLSAWKMNEFMPTFLVDHLCRRTDLHDSRVAILGFSFKADTDDLRDSLAPKLWRYVRRQLPDEIRISDQNLPDPIPEPSIRDARNWPISEALEDVDAVFVATNHTGYHEALRELARTRPDAWVADIWNVGRVNQMFYQAKALDMAEANA
ncbi:nucleotide sugar dehydrogenase [Pseudonocardia halophobica]|uniref:UDP-N-acetyl-D-glucosamine dehydrogenase n=1 Tax=Pseudonocardia halophobica TaxID=29401 RepID=A0A9W6L4R2_9PSEU|nr:nucleotide sugar dehydrogenase [Pseudonocardia halophobica]GLL12051.1 UDP-N-acetyl-D-glucosamine dehydrogenase [Pseudonocardia halophobica]